MPRRLRLFAVVAPAVLALDQASKAWARAALVPGRPRQVLALGRAAGDLELSHDTGAAFSLLAGAGGTRVLLSLLALAAAAAMAAWLARARDAGARLALGLSLGAAGALGNAIDRVAAGRVTDFVLWRWGGHRWPIFNVADAALVVGVALLLLSPRRGARSATASTPGPA